MLNDPNEAGYTPHGRGAAEGGGAGERELNGSARDAASLGGGDASRAYHEAGNLASQARNLPGGGGGTSSLGGGSASRDASSPRGCGGRCTMTLDLDFADVAAMLDDFKLGSNLTESLYKVILKKSIPPQIRQLLLCY